LAARASPRLISIQVFALTYLLSKKKITLYLGGGIFSGIMPSLSNSDELIFFVNGRKVSL